MVPYLIKYAHSCPRKKPGTNDEAGPHLAKIYVDNAFTSLKNCGTWSDLDSDYPERYFKANI